MDAPRIDTTHWRGQRGVHVIIIHNVVPQVLWLFLCSDLLDGQGHIIPVVIGPAVIIGSIRWLELTMSQVDERS